MSDRIKQELRNTVHNCAAMSAFKRLMLTNFEIWELKLHALGYTLLGEKKEWKVCPYCGLNFYKEGVTDEK